MEKEVTAYEAPPMSSLVNQGTLIRQKSRGAPPPLPITIIKAEESQQTQKDILNPPQSPPSSWGDSSLFMMPAVQDLNQNENTISRSIHNIPPTSILQRPSDTSNEMSQSSLQHQTSQRSGGSLNSTMCPPSRKGRSTKEQPVLLKPLVRDDGLKIMNDYEQIHPLQVSNTTERDVSVLPHVMSVENKNIVPISSSEDQNLHFQQATSLVYSRQSLPLLESMRKSLHKMHGTDTDVEKVVDQIIGEEPSMSFLTRTLQENICMQDEASDLIMQSNVERVVEGKSETEIEQRANEEQQAQHDKSISSWEREELNQTSLHHLLEIHKKLPHGYALQRQNMPEEGQTDVKKEDDIYVQQRTKWTALVHGKVQKEEIPVEMDTASEEEKVEVIIAPSVKEVAPKLAEQGRKAQTNKAQNTKAQTNKTQSSTRLDPRNEKQGRRSMSELSSGVKAVLPEPSHTVITAHIPPEDQITLDVPCKEEKSKLGMLAAKTLEYQLRKYKTTEEPASLPPARPQSTSSGSRSSQNQIHPIYGGNATRLARVGKERGKHSQSVTPVDQVHSTAKGAGKKSKTSQNSLQLKGEKFSLAKLTMPNPGMTHPAPSEHKGMRLCTRVQLSNTERPYIWSCERNTILISRATDEQIGSFTVEDTITSILSVSNGCHPVTRTVQTGNNPSTSVFDAKRPIWNDYDETQMQLDTQQTVVWVGTASGVVLLIDPVQLLVIARHVVHKSTITALVGSDSFIASADADGMVVLWRIDGQYCTTIGTQPTKINTLVWTLPPYPQYGVQEGRLHQSKYNNSNNTKTNNIHNTSNTSNNSNNNSNNNILDALSSMEKAAAQFIQQSHNIHQSAFYDAVHTPSLLYAGGSNGALYVIDCLAAESYLVEYANNTSLDKPPVRVSSDVAVEEMRKADQGIAEQAYKSSILPSSTLQPPAPLDLPASPMHSQSPTYTHQSPRSPSPTYLSNSPGSAHRSRSPTGSLASPRVLTNIEPVIVASIPQIPSLSQYSTSIKVLACLKVASCEITQMILVGGMVWTATSNNHIVILTIGPSPVVVNVHSVSSAIVQQLLVGRQVWVVTSTHEVVILDSITMAILGRLNRKGSIHSAVLGEAETSYKVYLGTNQPSHEVWQMTERTTPEYTTQLETDVVAQREWCRGILRQGKGRFELYHKNTELEYLAGLFQQDIDEQTTSLVTLEQKSEHGLSRIQDSLAATKLWTTRAQTAEGQCANQEMEIQNQKKLITLLSNMCSNLIKQTRKERSYFQQKASELHNDNNRLRVLTKEAVMSNAAEISKNMALTQETRTVTEKAEQLELQLELLDKAEQWETMCRSEAESSSISAKGQISELTAICRQLKQQEAEAEESRRHAEASEEIAVEQRRTAQTELDNHVKASTVMKAELEDQVETWKTAYEALKAETSSVIKTQADKIEKLTTKADTLASHNELLQRKYVLYKTDTENTSVLSAKLARTLANTKQRIESVRNVCSMSNQPMIDKELERISVDISKQMTSTSSTDRLVSGI